MIKALADVRPIAIDDADSIIRTFHGNLLKNTNEPLLPGLTEDEKKKLEEKTQEIESMPEKKAIDDEAAKDAKTAAVV